jgi:hypothetical protein
VHLAFLGALRLVADVAQRQRGCNRLEGRLVMAMRINAASRVASPRSPNAKRDLS